IQWAESATLKTIWVPFSNFTSFSMEAMTGICAVPVDLKVKPGSPNIPRLPALKMRLSWGRCLDLGVALSGLFGLKEVERLGLEGDGGGPWRLVVQPEQVGSGALVEVACP